MTEVTCYTTNENDDDFIVISDEDDEDFSRSQMYHISQQIKQEPTFEGFDPYQDIKDELKDLDYCDVVNYVPIDLTDEIDHFESTSDLLDVLEVSEPNQTTNQDLIDLLDDSAQIQPVELESLPESIQSTEIKKKCNGIEKEQKDKVVDPKLELKVVLQKENLRKCVKVVLQKENLRKYVKPPLIQPHSEMKATGPSQKKKKEPLKRKSTEQKRPEPTKKQLLTKSSIDSRQSYNSVKQEILEKRRRRLKELAEKAEKSKTKEPVKVKVSESRDEPLLPNNDDLHPKSFKPPTTSPMFKKAVQNKTIPHNEHIQYGSVACNLNLRNDSNNLTRLSPVNNNAHCSKSFPDSTINEDRSGLIWNISSHSNIHSSYNNARIIYGTDQEIDEIVRWNVGWLLEQKQLEISPPVNGNKQLLTVPLNFNDFENYVEVMTPLIMLELWQYVYQSTFNKEEERLPTRVRLEHERVMDPISCLDCSYPYPKSCRNMPFKQDDVCLLELRIKDSQNTYHHTCFGYIKNATRHNFGNLVRFTVVTKKLNKNVPLTEVIVKVVANVGSNLKLFSTMKQLQKSPLCQYILNPTKLSMVFPRLSYTLRNAPLLNPIQKEISIQASELALNNKPGFYLIKGPPGTGKSSVIVCIILEILYKAKRQNLVPQLLVTAPSNAAIDSLILKLNQARCELPVAGFTCTKEGYSIKMSVPIKYKCPKCGGETDHMSTSCLNCSVGEYFKTTDGAKHIPSSYYSGYSKN